MDTPEIDYHSISASLLELSRDDRSVYRALMNYTHGAYTSYLDMLEHLVRQLVAEKGVLLKDLIHMHNVLSRPLVIIPAKEAVNVADHRS